MNRVLLVGRLDPPEQIGKDASMPFWRSRLNDPSGSVSVTAGAFQPRAMAALRAITGPTSALVVGKGHLYRGRDDRAYPSVRAESVRALSELDARDWLAEILEQSIARLELLEQVRKEPHRPDTELIEAGHAPLWVRGARTSVGHYPGAPVGTLRDALRPVLESLRAATGSPTTPGLGTDRESVTIRRTSRPPARQPPTAAERAEEGAFLDLIDALSEESMDGYADLKDILHRAEARGIGSERAEELVNQLEESGALEEPVVGKLRRA